MNSKFTIFIVLLSLSRFVQCGDYFTVDGKSYYSSYPQKSTAFSSYEYCVYHGMNLIEVMDQMENERVVTVINAINHKHNTTTLSYWTCGMNLGSDGAWWWASNGFAAIYTNWAVNQPDNTFMPALKTTENCLVYGNAPNYEWQNAACIAEHYFLCRHSYDVPMFPIKSCLK